MFYKTDLTEGVRKQLIKLNEINLPLPRIDVINAILTKHCDSMCDHCVEILPISLDLVQNHYNDEHDTNGYIKCCEEKLTTFDQINDHILCHLHPEIFKLVD